MVLRGITFISLLATGKAAVASGSTCLQNYKATTTRETCGCTHEVIDVGNWRGPETAQNCVITTVSCGSKDGSSCDIPKSEDTHDACDDVDKFVVTDSSPVLVKNADSAMNASQRTAVELAAIGLKDKEKGVGSCMFSEAVIEKWLENESKAQAAERDNRR